MADNAHRKTDLKLEEMEKLAGDLSIDCLIIDPSAASFITALPYNRP